MRGVIILLVLLVAAVLWNSGPVPENPPWGVYKMPDTAQACSQARGTWKAASAPYNPFTNESEKSAYCEIAYADAGKRCTNSAVCTSKVCIVHPVTRKGSCLGYLPPRGRFEFLNADGNERFADMPM